MEVKWVCLALLVLSVFPTPEFILLGNQGVTGLAPIAPLAFIVACGMVCFSWIMLSMFLGSARFLRSWTLPQRFDNTLSGQQRSLRQSFLHLCLISALIVFLIPYQVVFLICFMIQWVTCCAGGSDKSKDEASPIQESSKRDKPDAFNQNTHILMLLLWLLPNMAPSLAVWVRTMATTGSVSLFNSDHSPLPVIPFLAVVELANARSPSPPFAPSHKG
jgi:glycosylphosphatidylinositol deacylase